MDVYLTNYSPNVCQTLPFCCIFLPDVIYSEVDEEVQEQEDFEREEREKLKVYGSKAV